MKKYKWIIWVVVVAAAATGLWIWKFKSPKATIALSVGHPYYGTITNSVTATGTVQPVDTVAVGTQVSGIIQSVYVDFNSPVKRGQLLAQLDKSLLNAQVMQIAANLQSAKANEVYQKSNFERQSHLYNVGAISKAEQETAFYQYRSAQESVSSLTAQLSSARKNLSFTNIYSPIAGTVLSRSVSEGQTVAASFNTPTLFSIAKDLTKMQVQAYIDEADIGNVQKGQRVQFTVDAFPADTFYGRVKEIRLRSSVSANVVSYITIIDAPNPDLKLKPGMTADITVFTRQADHALLVPAKAIAFQPDSIIAKSYKIEKRPAGAPHRAAGGDVAAVWLKKGDQLEHQPVRTGMDDETQVQILSGLSPGDEVVTGYEETKKATTGGRSPFMPRRPGSSNTRRTGGPPR